MLELLPGTHEEPLQNTVAIAIANVKAYLRKAAKENRNFNALISSVFNKNSDKKIAELRSKFLTDDLLLKVEVSDSPGMQGIRGAYYSGNKNLGERIYLNMLWLEKASIAEIESVLLEEIGHAIDQRINGQLDTPGDEGKHFSFSLLESKIDNNALLSPDQQTRWIDGEQINIEASLMHANQLPLENIDEEIHLLDPSFDLNVTNLSDDFDIILEAETSLSLIEQVGIASLFENAEGKAMIQLNQEMDIMPLLIDGKQLIVSRKDGYKLVGIEEINSAFSLVWMKSNNNLMVWDLQPEPLDPSIELSQQLNWHKQGSSRVRLESEEYFELEAKFYQDFNLDGIIGKQEYSYQVLEDEGDISVLIGDHDQGIYIQTSDSQPIQIKDKNNASLILQKEISPESINQPRASWTVQAAEQNDEKNLLLWNTGENMVLWQMNENWKQLKKGKYEFTIEYSDLNLLTLEFEFKHDLNGDGFIGPPSDHLIRIEDFGQNSLFKDKYGYVYVLPDSNLDNLRIWQVMVSKKGAKTLDGRRWNPLKINDSDNAKLIGAEKIKKSNYLIWGDDDSQTMTVTTLNRNWNKILKSKTIDYGTKKFYDYEFSFDQDVNKDGFIGNQYLDITPPVAPHSIRFSAKTVEAIREQGQGQDGFAYYLDDYDQLRKSAESNLIVHSDSYSTTAIDTLIIYGKAEAENSNTNVGPGANVWLMLRPYQFDWLSLQEPQEISIAFPDIPDLKLSKTGEWFIPLVDDGSLSNQRKVHPIYFSKSTDWSDFSAESLFSQGLGWYGYMSEDGNIFYGEPVLSDFEYAVFGDPSTPVSIEINLISNLPEQYQDEQYNPVWKDESIVDMSGLWKQNLEEIRDSADQEQFLEYSFNSYAGQLKDGLYEIVSNHGIWVPAKSVGHHLYQQDDSSTQGVEPFFSILPSVHADTEGTWMAKLPRLENKAVDLVYSDEANKKDYLSFSYYEEPEFINNQCYIYGFPYEVIAHSTDSSPQKNQSEEPTTHIIFFDNQTVIGNSFDVELDVYREYRYSNNIMKSDTDLGPEINQMNRSFKITFQAEKNSIATIKLVNDVGEEYLIDEIDSIADQDSLLDQYIAYTERLKPGTYHAIVKIIDNVGNQAEREFLEAIKFDQDPPDPPTYASIKKISRDSDNSNQSKDGLQIVGTSEDNSEVVLFLSNKKELSGLDKSLFIGKTFADEQGNWLFNIENINLTETELDLEQDLLVKGVVYDKFGNHSTWPGDETGYLSLPRPEKPSGYINDLVEITAPLFAETNDDPIGEAIALSPDGMTLAIGSPHQLTDNGPSSGQVSIFKRLEQGWKKVGESIKGESPGDQFGSGVAFLDNGQRLAIGAPGVDFKRENSGAVYIMENIKGEWNPILSPKQIRGKEAEERVGSYLSFSGNETNNAAKADEILFVGGLTPQEDSVQTLLNDDDITIDFLRSYSIEDQVDKLRSSSKSMRLSKENSTSLKVNFVDQRDVSISPLSQKVAHAEEAETVVILNSWENSTGTIRTYEGFSNSGLNLSPESDTGLKGDKKTNQTLPTLIGQAEQYQNIEVLEVSDPFNIYEVAQTTADSTGSWQATLRSELTAGTYVFQARAIDSNTGISSRLSDPLTIQIDNHECKPTVLNENTLPYREDINEPCLLFHQQAIVQLDDDSAEQLSPRLYWHDTTLNVTAAHVDGGTLTISINNFAQTVPRLKHFTVKDENNNFLQISKFSFDKAEQVVTLELRPDRLRTAEGIVVRPAVTAEDKISLAFNAGNDLASFSNMDVKNITSDNTDQTTREQISTDKIWRGYVEVPNHSDPTIASELDVVVAIYDLKDHTLIATTKTDSSKSSFTGYNKRYKPWSVNLPEKYEKSDIYIVTNITGTQNPKITGRTLESGTTIKLYRSQNRELLGETTSNKNGFWEWNKPADNPFETGKHSLTIQYNDAANNDSVDSDILEFHVRDISTDVPPPVVNPRIDQNEDKIIIDQLPIPYDPSIKDQATYAREWIESNYISKAAAKIDSLFGRSEHFSREKVRALRRSVYEGQYMAKIIKNHVQRSGEDYDAAWNTFVTAFSFAKLIPEIRAAQLFPVQIKLEDIIKKDFVSQLSVNNSRQRVVLQSLFGMRSPTDYHNKIKFYETEQNLETLKAQYEADLNTLQLGYTIDLNTKILQKQNIASQESALKEKKSELDEIRAEVRNQSGDGAVDSELSGRLIQKEKEINDLNTEITSKRKQLENHSKRIFTYENFLNVEGRLRGLNEYALIRDSQQKKSKKYSRSANTAGLVADIASWTIEGQEKEEFDWKNFLLTASSAFELLASFGDVGMDYQRTKKYYVGADGKVKKIVGRAEGGLSILSTAMILGVLSIENINLDKSLSENEEQCLNDSKQINDINSNLKTSANLSKKDKKALKDALKQARKALQACQASVKSENDAIKSKIALNTVQASFNAIEGAADVAQAALQRGAMSTFSKGTVKVLGRAAAFFGVAAAVIGAMEPQQWNRFEQKQNEIDSFKEMEDFSSDLVVEALQDNKNRAETFHTVNAVSDVLFAVAGAGVALAGLSGGVSLAVTGVSLAVAGALVLVEQMMVQDEIAKLREKMENKAEDAGKDATLEDYYDAAFEDQRKAFKDQIEDDLDDLIDSGKYDAVTAGFSLTATQSDLVGAAYSQSGDEIKKTARHYFDTRVKDDKKAGKRWSNEAVELKVNEGEINLKDIGNNKNRLVNFVSPLMAPGNETMTRKQKGSKEEYITSITIKDLEKGWKIRDAGNVNTTYSLNDNIITRAQPEKDADYINIGFKIDADKGDDLYFANQASLTFDGGEGDDTASYSSSKFSKSLLHDLGIVITNSEILRDHQQLEAFLYKNITPFSVQATENLPKFEGKFFNSKDIGSSPDELVFDYPRLDSTSDNLFANFYRQSVGDWKETIKYFDHHITQSTDHNSLTNLRLEEYTYNPFEIKKGVGSLVISKFFAPGMKSWEEVIDRITQTIDEQGKYSETIDFRSIRPNLSQSPSFNSDSLSGVENISGTSKDDWVDLTGSSIVRSLHTRSGDDVVYSGSGLEFLDTADGDDLIYLDNFPKNIDAGKGNDKIILHEKLASKEALEFLESQYNTQKKVDKSQSASASALQANQAHILINGGSGEEDTIVIPDSFLPKMIEDYKFDLDIEDFTNELMGSGTIAQSSSSNSTQVPNIQAEQLNKFMKEGSRFSILTDGIEWAEYSLPTESTTISLDSARDNNLQIDLVFTGENLNGIRSGSKAAENMYFMDDYKGLFNHAFPSRAPEKLINLHLSADEQNKEVIIFGSKSEDKITGSKHNDTIHSRAGNDILTGGSGHDIYVGGLGEDTYDVGYTSSDDNQHDFITGDLNIHNKKLFLNYHFPVESQVSMLHYSFNRLFDINETNSQKDLDRKNFSINPEHFLEFWRYENDLVIRDLKEQFIQPLYGKDVFKRQGAIERNQRGSITVLNYFEHSKWWRDWMQSNTKEEMDKLTGNQIDQVELRIQVHQGDEPNDFAAFRYLLDQGEGGDQAIHNSIVEEFKNVDIVIDDVMLLQHVSTFDSSHSEEPFWKSYTSARDAIEIHKYLDPAT